MRNRTKYSPWILLLTVFSARAQHFQFSQFYAAPTYLNPAFTGANACGRVTLNYRNQWTGIPGAFTTYQASFDHYLPRMKSGIGLQLFNDRAGVGSLTTTQVNALYAYETRVSKKWMGRAGVSAGNVQRKADITSFTFGDQIQNNAATSEETISSARASYFDFGAGVLFYSKDVWCGAAFSHINRPNQSLLNGVSLLPAEMKLHAGYNFHFEEEETTVKSKLVPQHYITIAANYKKQSKFNQLDVGAYYNKNMVVIGCWYRGLPFFRPVNSYRNSDAVIFLFGLAMGKCKAGYSYDMTVSKLTNQASNGSHEISMTYQFCDLKKPSKRKKNGLISCPKF